VRYSYRPAIAHAQATRIKSRSRSAIATSKEELVRIDALLAGQLKVNKQSLEVIAANPKNKITVSPATLRRYVEGGHTKVIRLDLLSAPSRRVRKKRAKPASRHSDDGRSYSDFTSLAGDVQASAWEMDTVFGTRSERCCLLTLHNRESLFTFIFKIAACTIECVVGILDYLEDLCEQYGISFKSIFAVILTDNGIEFSDAEAMETSALGKGKRTSLYFCDPYSSWQKGSIEGRHSLMRRALPKGSAISRLTHTDIALLSSHLNSYPAISRDGQTPIDMACRDVSKEVLCELGIERIDAECVALRHGLMTDR
jgi:IS30 family transposase